MKTKKKSILSLLLILVMICTYVVEQNSFTTYAAEKERTEQSEDVTQEAVLFEGSEASTNWGQAVTLKTGSDFSKSDLTLDAQIAVTYEGIKEPVLSLQSWTHNDIWQNVSATYSLDGVAYFSVSEMMEVYERAYGTGYLTAFQDLDAIYVSDAGADLTVTKVTITRKEVESNYYTKEGEITKVTVKAYAQNTTDDWTWMGMDNGTNLLYKTETALNASNITDVFAQVNSSANFGIQVCDEKLTAGDGCKLKFHVGTVKVKADGYDDFIINLDKDYNESYLAEEVSWGLTGNNTVILLNNYLPSDKDKKTAYLQKVTDVIADVTLTDYEFIEAKVEEPEFPDDYTYPTTMRDISAMDLVKDMKVGWNLGNTLEAAGGETNWGNPMTKRKMIDTLKTAGFSTIRIPVRWDEHYIDDNYTIDPDYMKRVETVVNYALVNDMYAIINIHHNQLQSQVNEKSKDKVLKELDAIWTQVANNFKNYGDKLIFETINEPRNNEDWIGNTRLYEIVNEYNVKALSAIRSSGGNNEKRLVMLPTYAASADYSKIINMVVPEDDHVAVSIHAYSPYDFALNSAPGSQSTFGEKDKEYLDKLFKLLNKTFVEKGIPVVLGEFAATNKDNLEDRVEYTYHYAQAAGHYEMPCCWWDNGNFVASGDSMGLLNRRTLTFAYPEILKALLEGWSSEKEIKEEDANVLFSGKGTSSSWGQAVSLNLGLDFVYDDFTDGLVIAVEYTSENAPELILAGKGTGVNWVKVNPTKIYVNETSNVAYFTLVDMVSAYKKALEDYDSYDTIFPTLETIFIGDTGSDLTVTKVYKTDADGMNLPSVKVTTKNNGSSICQTYTITAERGDIDLSKVKIVYTATGMSTEKQNSWCYYAGLLEKESHGFTPMTDLVTTKVNNARLELTIGKGVQCKEKTGRVTMYVGFAKKDWSDYGVLSNPKLQVYYNGKLVQ
jgi:endoglucanase